MLNFKNVCFNFNVISCHTCVWKKITQELVKCKGTKHTLVCPEKLSNPAVYWLVCKREVVNGNMATVCPLPVSQQRDVTRIFRLNLCINWLNSYPLQERDVFSSSSLLVLTLGRFLLLKRVISYRRLVCKMTVVSLVHVVYKLNLFTPCWEYCVMMVIKKCTWSVYTNRVYGKKSGWTF